MKKDLKQSGARKKAKGWPGGRHGKDKQDDSPTTPSFEKPDCRAERYLKNYPESLDELSRQELKALVHELGACQVELEMQNEELRRALDEQEQSRRRFADLYDCAPVGYFSLDAQGSILAVNLTGATMLAMPKSRLDHMPFSTCIHPEDADTFQVHLRRTKRAEEKQTAEVRLQGREGPLPARLESLAVSDAGGAVVEIRTAVIDISDRVEAELILQEKSAILRTIIDTTDFMLVCLDPAFNFIWVNPAYAEACGMTPVEMAGKNHFALYPHSENERIFRQVRDSGEAVFFKDKPFVFPDQPERGTTYWDWSLSPVKNAQGEVTALVFSLRETTEHKRAQLALAESEERFRLIAETSADIIFQTDPAGRVTYVSPAVRMLGYRAEEVEGKLFFDFIPAAEMGKADEALRRVNQGGDIRLLELQVLNADGSEVTCEISAVPIIKDGVVIGAQGVSRDISERKLAEERIRHKGSMLAGINTIFEAAFGCESDEDLAAAVLRVAGEITGSDCGFIGEIGSDGLLHDLAIRHPGGDAVNMCDRNGLRRQADDFRPRGLCDRVLDEGVAFFSNDPSGHPSFSAFLGVPLEYYGKTIGLIGLTNRRGGFRENDLTTVRTLAPVFVETLFRCRAERALKESEMRASTTAAQLKQFLDFIPNPVWIAHDRECRVITGNLAACRMIGVAPGQNISRSADPGVKKPDLRIFRDGRELALEEMPLQCAVRQGSPVDAVEMDLVLPDGRVVRMLGAATPLFDAAGNVAGGIGAYMDITERKRMEEQLLQAKLEWEKTFDAVPDLIAVLDPQHRIIRANRAMAQKIGAGPGQCVGHYCFSCVHGTDHPVDSCPNARTLRDGREYMEEVHDARLGGDFLVTTTPLFDDQGEIVATVHVARDITWIKESERLVRESEQRLNRAQRIAHLGSWELDQIDNTLAWSDEVFRIFGLEPQAFVPTVADFLALVHPADRKRVEGMYLDSMRDGSDNEEIEHRIVRGSTGEVRYVLQRFEHLRDETGRVLRSSGMVHDITERKLAEEEITVLNKRLQYSIRELSIANRELERSNRDLQQFAYIISHDLQEPLRTVSSFVQLLSRRYRDALDDKAMTFISYAVDGAEYMKVLLDDLLKFSRVGGGELRLQVLSLESVLQKTLASLKSSIDGQRAEIRYNSLPEVVADELLLGHVLQNLISNSLKFRGSDNPRIDISAEKREDEWVVCVRDNGIGIDPQYAERIFLIFQRLHRRVEIEGTGIGLAICKRIVELHGGRIWVESAPGEGAAFYFSLPDPGRRDGGSRTTRAGG